MVISFSSNSLAWSEAGLWFHRFSRQALPAATAKPANAAEPRTPAGSRRQGSPDRLWTLGTQVSG